MAALPATASVLAIVRPPLREVARLAIESTVGV
jgi:hypothetical protein